MAENKMMTDSGVPSLQRYAWISIGAAIATILLKGVAWQITGSVGLLSDAIESFVNLAGALMALWMLWLAEQPADEDHPHGHGIGAPHRNFKCGQFADLSDR